jgi:hypothetical protein
MDTTAALHALLDLLAEQTWIPTECAEAIAALRIQVETPTP